MATNLLAQLAPQQQDSVKSNWGELFNVMGGSKENVAMELAKQYVCLLHSNVFAQFFLIRDISIFPTFFFSATINT